MREICMMRDHPTWMSGKVQTRSLLTSLSVVCACLQCSCSGTNKVDLLEARLREQEVVVQNYEREVAGIRSQLNVAQREAKILRNQLVHAGEKAPAVEATEALASVETLKFNGLLTAGQNKDDTPGDERFHAIVSPYDASGELVKVIGKVELEAIDLSLPEDQRTVGRWEYTPEKALEIWHAGFLSTGYRFELPWKTLPQSDSVLLHVKLETPDGRQLSASHTMKIEKPQALAGEIAAPKELNVADNVKQVEAGQEVTSEVKQVTKEESTDSAVPKDTPEKVARPEPVLDLFEKPDEKPGKATIVPISFEQERSKSVADRVPDNPRPFPGGIQTSDNWTDATIPVVR